MRSFGFVAAGFLVLTGAVVACAPTKPVAAPATAPTVAPSDSAAFAEASAPMYRSDRLGLTFPLPDRKGWVIEDKEDRNSGWLVATHVTSSTVLRVRRTYEPNKTSRHECERTARALGEWPKDDSKPERFQVMSDESLMRPKGWDGRRWVAFEPRAGGSLAGHVLLASGQGHSCILMHVVTVAAGGEVGATTLADRLVVFSGQVVGGILADRAEGPDLPRR